MPPASLAECLPEPTPPVIPVEQSLRDQVVIDWIAGLRTAHGSCKSKVDGLKAWMAEASKP